MHPYGNGGVNVLVVNSVNSDHACKVAVTELTTVAVGYQHYKNFTESFGNHKQ